MLLCNPSSNRDTTHTHMDAHTHIYNDNKIYCIAKKQ